MGTNNLPARLCPAKTLYMMCMGAGRKPLEYIGQWPRRGRIYCCRIITDFWTGEEYVLVDGLVVPEPFKRYRFDLVAEVWLN